MQHSPAFWWRSPRKAQILLKTDYFDGYKGLLDELSEKHQQEFVAWMKTHQVIAQETKDTEKVENKPIKRKIYRYLYRDYLQPKSLPINKRHNHNI